ncbi:MAG: twin-arginine translocase TatA/TatE family subunit [Wenzhouxiangella sp.]|nr:twin-arginine translocase TatA/TatE family subunit [Wenzhouxiangella sp.]MCH8478172.1 twin-arginine translocase TatA/TatE family subunit [Wenzhouxiangella sp.]TVR97881.1 MAG: twin-arginine translocase TatA/TatE family subunit [Wenzhouxiangellaceae bacterium]
MGNIGPVQLILILLLVLLLFGTKRIRSLGSDLGGAIRDFRKGVSEDSDTSKSDAAQDQSASTEAGNNDPNKSKS